MWGLPTVSYHSAKFDGHRYCGSAEIRFFHLPRDHVIKRHVTLKVRVPLSKVTTLSSLAVIGIAEWH